MQHERLAKLTTPALDIPAPIPYTHRMQRAFSLVELSIVLVILGLLTGGILAGQSLIRAAELRSVTTEHQRITAATQTFRDKYFALPGDMNNATRFWNRTVNAAHCVTNSAAAVTTPGTCDGTGNGLLAGVGAAGLQSGEIFQMWRQLALAGLMEGSYTGLAGSADAAHHILGENAPASRISTAIWSTFGVGVHAGSASAYALDYGNYLHIGGQTSANLPTNPIFRPEEAWNIDTKMDDGRPAYGNIIARHWNNACAEASTGVPGDATNTNLNARYRLTDNSIECALFFIKAF